ncbi:cytochrome ubiquinol oxidase subunit I [Acuticoccus mangrovi]|uniref:Cytochrome ubiquinol oxidase subunit I n=1 Tax=Acuticoccus mangrovi TaxID=2796142 RepID=A0A934MCP7_9HYPH|nr:cytochrome ubiquinol oxidase subunit I [Acuticoccus mangrovi]MBJ3775497.1 cytochrome ubiquinol oxidase subunit I [Acuticoccus mangrovi]
MDIDPVILARVQFAFTVSFHIIFPSFTIGLAAWIATLEGMWLATNNDRYHLLARFWTKVFAVSFGMGVVSGIVLSYQFGTNWSRYSEVVGNVVGPLIGYEVLTAFFLEATFLGLMLFGWNRVPPWLHFLACLAVAVGTTLSAFWILSANSWMQHPAGHEVRDGIAYPVDWLKIIFSPTFPTRLGHMVVAAYITTAFVVLASGARWLRAGIATEQAKTMVRMGLGLLVVLVPLQGFLGDASGENTLKYQPVKVAAMEGHWEQQETNEGPMPWVVFGWPNEAQERNDFQISIPYLGSIILTRTLDGTIKGLKDFPADERPPVAVPFFGFRIMVALWGIMMLAVIAGVVLWWRGRLFDTGAYTRIVSQFWPIGFCAILAGWFTTEVGRQPWVATGILRTADAISPVPGESVLITLILFVMVYGIVFSSGVFYINRLLKKGPVVPDTPEADVSGLRPLSGAKDAGRDALQPGE